ncbi:hypothetical protein VNO78_25992 [Psophocarpus tetragonolobus]|uniref:Uncharacterized protein n=1 Tax=Psophocarpus tetragonolobus TaxID=3891 RepID=A0AAN9S7E5_PSOTE
MDLSFQFVKHSLNTGANQNATKSLSHALQTHAHTKHSWSKFEKIYHNFEAVPYKEEKGKSDVFERLLEDFWRSHLMQSKYD